MVSRNASFLLCGHIDERAGLGEKEFVFSESASLASGSLYTVFVSGNFQGVSKMSENRANPPRMSVDEILSAIGGPTAVPHQPEGPSTVTPLSPLGLDKATTTGESFPANVGGQQGAGGSSSLTPYAGRIPDGTVEPGNDDHYADQGGPAQRPLLSDVVGRLTAGATNRPEGGDVAAAPVGRPDTALGRDQGEGQGINPAIKKALAPRPGPFGESSL